MVTKGAGSCGFRCRVCGSGVVQDLQNLGAEGVWRTWPGGAGIQGTEGQAHLEDCRGEGVRRVV